MFACWLARIETANVRHASARWPTHGELVRSEDLTGPLAALQKCPDLRHFVSVVGMYVDQHSGPIRNRQHIVAGCTRLDATGNEFRVDVHHALDCLMTVIGADKQQHVVTRRAQPFRRPRARDQHARPHAPARIGAPASPRQVHAACDLARRAIERRALDVSRPRSR